MFSFLRKNEIIVAVFCSLFIIISVFFLTEIDFKLLDSKYKETITVLNNKFLVFAQEISPFFFPRFPQRLMYLSSEISLASEELVYLNEGLNNSIAGCDCKFAQSQCSSAGLTFNCLIGSEKVFGDPCKDREEIEEKQAEIKIKAEQISTLRNLLEKEMEIGMERELKSLRPEVAEDLRSNLNKILNDSQNIISLAENNRDLPYNCSVKKCSASCRAGSIFGLDVCFGVKSEQKAIEVRYKLSVGIDDLDLGQIGINTVNLGLPKEIEIARLGQLSSFVIAGEEIIIPLSEIQKTIRLQIPKPPSLPQPPVLTLSCPKFPSYLGPEWEWSTCAEMGEKSITGLSSLSLDYPGRAFGMALYGSEAYSQKVVLRYWSNWAPGQRNATAYITTPFCDAVRTYYDGSQDVFDINGDGKFDDVFHDDSNFPGDFLGYCYNSATGQYKSPQASDIICQINMQTQDFANCPDLSSYSPPNLWLVIQGNVSDARSAVEMCLGNGGPKEPIYPICSAIGIPPETTESIKEAASKQCKKLFSEEGESPPTDCDFNPVETLKNKCNSLKEAKRKEVPEPCKILPLFTGEIEKPDSFSYEGPSREYPAQTIGNYPSSMLGCEASLPTIPQICLPSIVLPDLKLPEINLKPFLYIKLPNIILEDLIFPCINLCDINECQYIFPSLNFQFPTLSIPTVEIPPIQLGTVLGIPLPDLIIDPIRFPHIPYPIFRLPTLGNLVMPELEIPSISLPKPKIDFSFSGVDFGPIWDYIVTFVLNALGVPDFSLCISFSLNIIPIQIVFPDYIFSWPAFPQIPEIPFCKDTNEFCLKAKVFLAGVINKAKEIERVFNALVQKEIQSRLDQAAPIIQKELEKSIRQKLDPTIAEIRRQAEQQISQGKKTIVINIGSIEIPSIYLDGITEIPLRITIPWPKELEKINLTTPITYDLPKIPLSKLNYSKEVIIRGPAFQARTASIDLGNLGNRAECLSRSPSGGNPCPTNQFQVNLVKVKSLEQEINKTSQKIINILE